MSNELEIEKMITNDDEEPLHGPPHREVHEMEIGGSSEVRPSTDEPPDRLHHKDSSSDATFEEVASDEKQNTSSDTECSTLKNTIDQAIERAETDSTSKMAESLPFSNPKNENSDQEISSGDKCFDDTPILKEKMELVEFNNEQIGNDLKIQPPVEVTKESLLINGVGEFIDNSHSTPQSPPLTNRMVLCHESSDYVARQVSQEVSKENAIMNAINEVGETSICDPESPPSTSKVDECHETQDKNDVLSSFAIVKENIHNKKGTLSPQAQSQLSIDTDPTSLETSALNEANRDKEETMEELSDVRDYLILDKTSESCMSDGQYVVESLVQEMLDKVTKFERKEGHVELGSSDQHQLTSSNTQDAKAIQSENFRDDKSVGVEEFDALFLTNEQKLELKGFKMTPSCENDPQTKLEERCVKVSTKDDKEELCQSVCEELQKENGKLHPTDKQSILGSPKTLPDLQNYQDNLLPRVSLLRLKRLSSSKPCPGVCSSCSLTVSSNGDALVWETMIFCNIQCIVAYQKSLQHCKQCQVIVDERSKGKFCIRFGTLLNQFCSSVCLDLYRKNLRMCSICQVVLKESEGHLVDGAKSSTALVCSQKCHSEYKVLCGMDEEILEIAECRVCFKVDYLSPILLLENGEVIKLCSLDCFVDFKRQLTLTVSPCECCGLFVEITNTTSKTVIHGKGLTKVLCSIPCNNVYISQTREIGACTSCGVKKFNYDLIEEAAPKSKRFCSAFCFNNRLPPTNNDVTAAKEKNLSCLAFELASIISTFNHAAKATVSLDQVEMRSKSVIAKPLMATKGVTCRPHPILKETQTENPPPPGLVPIGVPMYVPFPMSMYHRPYPIPVPVPIPIPVPIFIPTTRHSIRGITKQIKKIRAKLPSDPYEAEMLALAGELLDKEPDSSDSDSEDEFSTNDPDETKDPASTAKVQIQNETFVKQSVLDLESDIKGSRVIPKQPEPSSETTPSPLSDNINRSIQSQAVPVQIPQQRGPQHVLQQIRSQQNKRKLPQRDDGNDEEDENAPWKQKMAKTKIHRPKEMRKNHQSRDSALTNSGESPDLKNHLKYTYGVNAWKHWVVGKNAELERRRAEGRYIKPFETDILKLRADELNYTLCMFVQEARKPNGENYAPDSILYLTLGIQEYLFENGRIDNIFMDYYYEPFTTALHEVMNGFKLPRTDLGEIVTRIEEEDLWESNQLGVHSPQVLLNTLVYFNTKFFKLKSADDHMKLAFPHIVKHWKKTNPSPTSKTSTQNLACQARSAVLRYNQPPGKVIRAEERRFFEQHQNHENPLRCPIKIYEFYLSKCSDMMKSRSDAFYLQPERYCNSESPVWYTLTSVPKSHLEKMLQRILVVKEIQEYLLSEPQ